MKKYLLTWYGIADFRASLGFEFTEGPIAAALDNEDYSDVVILCYTRASDESNDPVETETCFSAALSSIRELGQQGDRKTAEAFVSKFANTRTAHKHFAQWLEAKVRSGGGSTKLWFVHETLRELNDTEGIYSCAMRALDFVALQTGEKLVTLNLSPGTPVMAFVWAFAALGHPDLKKRLIASPVIGKPPEVISLPSEWLERHGASRAAIRDVSSGFDLTFHLFGEQRMPSLLGIRQFQSTHHVFVNSKDYPARCMRAFTPNGEFEELPVDPWNACTVREQILQAARRAPTNARIGVNLTGGTKLMFAGALSAARALGAVSFYFDSQNRRVTFIDSLRTAPIRPIETVETFLLLNGDGLKVVQNDRKNDSCADRRLLTETLWRHRKAIAAHYRNLAAIADEHQNLLKQKARLTPFKLECNGMVFKLNAERGATVVGNGIDMAFQDPNGFARYLCGGWLEEYLYLQCKPYEEAGVIKDLHINVELTLDRANSRVQRHWLDSHNELDVVFTDGYSLYIAECKAGRVTQEQVMKLQNLVRFYGGIEGHGILACCFPPHSDSVRKKIKDAKLSLFCGDDFVKHLKKFMDGIAQREKANPNQS